jgi:hypothetical protein
VVVRNKRSAALIMYPGGTNFCGLKGHESIAQASAWVYLSNDTTLTRRYLVAPCWKNTRSAGLEVLKGRQNRLTRLRIPQRHVSGD